MGFITNDEHGIPDKKVYVCIARALKKGMFAPKRIDEDVARACTDLKLACDEITNLDFLSFFPNLEDLELKTPNLSDIGGLRYVQNLDWLHINSHALTDISPLAHCPKLTCLQLRQTPDGKPGIRDFTVIGRLGELTQLALNGNGVADISWITSLQKLIGVELEQNPITDFSPLLQLPCLAEVYLGLAQQMYIDERFSHLPIEIEHDM